MTEDIRRHHALEAELNRLRRLRDLGLPELRPAEEDRVLDEMKLSGTGDRPRRVACSRQSELLAMDRVGLAEPELRDAGGVVLVDPRTGIVLYELLSNESSASNRPSGGVE